MTRYRTRRGQAIDPVLPARFRDGGGNETDKPADAKYRLCQVLPVAPQRFEWVNVTNILHLEAV